jgi:outer membrane protein OmpA-like peptidoglycan-associated protein
MNTRTLALAAFVAWSALCWRWYVCKIKEACDDDRPVPEKEIITPIVETDTQAVEDHNAMTTAPPTQAVPTVSNTPAKPAKAVPTTVPETTKPISANRMNEVQMERVEDRMVIHFPYNSIRREDNGAIADYLGRLAEQLIASGERVSITGHTDFVGEPKENLQFGLRRAESIKNALVKLGVSAKQVRCYSKGDTKPVAPNDTPLGRYKNRRVEIRIGK